jgi:hypothetical protein
LPDGRVAFAVKDRNDDKIVGLDSVENAVGKSLNDAPANILVNALVASGVAAI